VADAAAIAAAIGPAVQAVCAQMRTRYLALSA
jgi:hypothetical protein